MSDLTAIQRRILAVLEEPGSYGITVLLNLVARPSGNYSDIDCMVKSLIDLFHRGLIDIANERDVTSLEWLPLNRDAAITQILLAQEHITWDTGDKYWLWNEKDHWIEILLSDQGFVAAQRILVKDGWPENPLESYNYEDN